MTATHTRPRALFALSTSLAAMVAVLGGCPGSLTDRASFERAPDCPGNIDVELLLAQRCGSAICHGGQSGAPQGGLDLTSAGLRERLPVDAQRVEHSCSGMPLIDQDNPDNSFILAKIQGPPAACGDRMPLVGSLSRDEIQCIRAYVHLIADQPWPDAGMPPTDAGQDAGQDAGADASFDAGNTSDAALTDGGP